MKTILFFIAILLCGVDFAKAELLTNMTCTDEYGTSHTIKIDRDDLYTLLVDNKPYDFIKDSTIGDINLIKYQSENDKTELAYIDVEIYQDDNNEETMQSKLVLMRDGDKEAQFGALCTNNE